VHRWPAAGELSWQAFAPTRSRARGTCEHVTLTVDLDGEPITFNTGAYEPEPLTSDDKQSTRRRHFAAASQKHDGGRRPSDPRL
jgi:hypothetical protein